jgi:hypothetical protein
MTEIQDSTAVCEKKQARQRDLFFCIPSRIILNEQGTSFFIAHHKPLHCFETADGGRHFGFHLEKTGNITGFLKDPGKRKALMAKGQFRGSTVVVAVPGEIPRENRRLRFRISVYNDGADVDAERKLMEDFTDRNFSFKDGRDLEEFFKTPLSRQESGLYGDSGLYFYHLNTLQDQCRKHRILLDAAIKNAHSGKSVVTTLWFGF